MRTLVLVYRSMKLFCQIALRLLVGRWRGREVLSFQAFLLFLDVSWLQLSGQ